jgi:hypothetical protein
MSSGIRLLADSDVIAGSDKSEPVAVGFSSPIWLKRGDGPGQSSRVRHPSLGGHELPAADSTLFARDCRVRGQRRRHSARCERLLADSDVSPLLPSLLSLRLPTS